jgi:fructose-1,6-bisphosphatase/inositol monophosphatase family enzyme
VIALPPPLAASPWAARLDIAINAVRAAGVALLTLRGQIAGTEAAGGQLKTAIDLAAEGWVLGFLEGSFPGDVFLAEERFDREGVAWPGAPTYWTIDALDGTRSYVEGFDGFCVQVAYVEGGVPRVGVICEPVTGAIYAGADGGGAWKLEDGHATRLPGATAGALRPGLRFVDSTRPTGGATGDPISALFAATQGQLVECGSVGLKICRLVEDAADVYVKRFAPKLWDVAPGEVLIRETGGVLASWDGSPFDYAGTRTHYDGVVAASSALYPALRAALTGS